MVNTKIVNIWIIGQKIIFFAISSINGDSFYCTKPMTAPSEYALVYMAHSV